MSSLKRIKILSRPDHSISLFEGLVKNNNIDVAQFTFNAIKKGSIFTKVYPNKRHISSDINVSLFLTVFHRLLKPIRTRINFNWLKYEVLLTEKYFSKIPIESHDLVHYWPIYCAHSIEKAKSKIKFTSIAEVYEADPNYVNEIFSSEYRKYGLDFKPYNTMTDQNYFLDFERNVMVPSLYVKNTYSGCRRFNEINFHVVPYGVDISEFPSEKKDKFKSNGRLRVVLVGRATIEKGIHIYTKAAKALSSEIDFDVIGPTNNLPSKIKNESEGHVTFLGALDKKTLFENLLNYDVMILPSLSDAYSLSVIEAQVIGLPVIVSTNVGNADVVIHHNSGLVFESGNSSDLISKIKQINDLETLENLSNNAIENINFHTSESYSDRVLQTYNIIMSKKKL